MFCYRVVDDCVVRREFKKKFTTDEELSRFVIWEQRKWQGSQNSL